MGPTNVQAAPSPLLLAVRINGEAAGDFIPVLNDAGRWYARAEDLAVWRLHASGSEREMEGTVWHPLPGAIRFDTATQTLDMILPANAFELQRIDLRSASQTPVAAAVTPGLALDYDFNLQTGGGRPQAAALLDIGAFGLPHVPGTLRHRTVVRNTASSEKILRLDTQWRIEDLDRLRTWTLGDTVTCSGEFAGAARFAGVQLATDFGLRPDLVTFPLPALSGSASVPGAVDLLVDGRVVGSTQVGSGPFVLDNPPLVGGAGEVTVVQQDVLGRMSRVSVPYYVSPRLLRPGLTDYCAEAGWLRRDYGIESGHYDGAFSAVGAKLGMTPALTVAGRLEIGPVKGMHLGAHWLAGGLGVVTAQTAVSGDAHDTGAWGMLRAERQTGGLSLVASIEAASEKFRRLGGERTPARRASVFGGLPLGGANLALAAVWQEDRTGKTTHIANASVSSRMADRWFGQVALQRQDRETAIFAVFTRPFGDAGHVALSGQTRGGSTQATLQAQSSEPQAGGWGWQIALGAGEAARQQAGLNWLGDAGRYSIEAARDAAADTHALRMGGRGGMVWTGGAQKLTRSLGDGAVARVRVPGVPGVPVLYQHRVVTKTDDKGDAWVTGLLPYENNTIGIDPQALPLAARLDREFVVVRPPARAAVALDFPLVLLRSALVSVVDVAGAPIPPGVRAQMPDGRTAPFGRNGEVYVEGLAARNQLEIDRPGGRCTVEFEAPPGDDPQPRIGPLVCRTLL
jgi:outer membrane usher protein